MKRTATKSSIAWKLVLMMSLVGMVLRVSGISVRNICGDEILSLAIATGHNWYDSYKNPTIPKTDFYRSFISLDPSYFSQRLIPLMRSETQMPFYYFLLNLCLHPFGTSEGALRVLSIMASIGSIPLLYWLGLSLFSREVGLYSALILSLAPFQVAHGLNARPYSLMLLLAILSTIFAFRLSQGEMKWKWFLGYGITAVLGFYTHHLFICNIAFHLILVTFCQRKNSTFLVRWGLTELLVAGLMLLWTPIILDQLQLNRQENTLHWMYYYSRRLTLHKEIGYAIRNFSLFTSLGSLVGLCTGTSAGGECRLDRVATRFFHIVPACIFVLCVCGFWLEFRRHSPRKNPHMMAWGTCLLWVSCIFVPPIAFDLLSGKGMVRTPYYFISASPAIYLLIAMTIASLPKELYRNLTVSALFLLLAVEDIFYLKGFDKTIIDVQGYRNMAEFLDKSATADDLVLLNSPNFSNLNLAYYLKSDLDLDTILQQQVQWNDPEEIWARMQKLTSNRQRVWYMTEHGPDTEIVLDWFRSHFQQSEPRSFDHLELTLYENRAGSVSDFSELDPRKSANP